MKIAIISTGDSSNLRTFNVLHNRVKYLIINKNFEIKVYLIRNYENLLIRTLQKTKKEVKEDFLIYDGIRYNNLWFNSSIIDYLLRKKLNCQGPFFLLSCRKWTKLFREFDFISAYAYRPGLLAFNIYQKYKIPFTIFWRGGDIHLDPFLNPSVFKWTKRLLVNAQYNSFPSEGLAEFSRKIAEGTNRVVLYNGVDKSKFKKFDKSEIESIQKKYYINGNNKNIAYFGRLESDKNADSLPRIFNLIGTDLPEASFFIIGDGKLRQTIEKESKKRNVKVSMLGRLDSLEIPALINCMDLILLPSKNEGLPLIALESIACGTPIIGSRGCGIDEAIGLENTVELNETFIEEFSRLAIAVIRNKKELKLNPLFDWSKVAELEGQLFEKYRLSAIKERIRE